MDELKAPRPLAVVTGASTGIGYHLARCAAEHGYDLVVAADTPLEQAEGELKLLGAQVECVQCDLATTQGVDKLLQKIDGRPVGALLANAGHGLGGAFLQQDWPAILHVINTNITGTVYLVHSVARHMQQRAHGQGFGRILITGSVAGFQAGSFHAIYNATKAFVDSFALALHNELKDSKVTVSCLMPGPTDTEFFERADLMDTRMADIPKSDPAKVARIGFDAMLRGEADVVAGWANKLQVALSKAMPAEATAAAHRKLAEPGSAKAVREHDSND
jgi:short-subunit dehydrogenase